MADLTTAALLLAATQSVDVGVLGSWCGEVDYAIWIGREEAVLGEHAFCRWDVPVTGVLSHYGVLLCRTTQDLHPDTVEHPLPVALSLDASGGLTIDYPDGGTPEYLRPCGD